MIVVNSFGGCATTIFVDHFKKHGVHIPLKTFAQENDASTTLRAHTPVRASWTNRLPIFTYKHISIPPQDCDKAVYIFSDPAEAVMSFFRRRSEGYNKTMRGKGEPVKSWAVGHCGNIDGDHKKMDKEWDLTDYLNQGEELFKLERHFDNWTKADRQYPILLVKYEKMWENLKLIHNFMGCPDAISDFPERKERGSSLENLSPKDRHSILKMYGALREKISLAPDISEILPR